MNSCTQWERAGGCVFRIIVMSVALLSHTGAVAASHVFTLPSANWHLPYSAPHPEFVALADALTRYQKLAAAGGWAPIDPGASLAMGANGLRVGQLRNRLKVTGDDTTKLDRIRDRLPPKYRTLLTPGSAGIIFSANPLLDPLFTFDSSLLRAVKRFQARHGLRADGKVGPRTLQAMNVSVDEKVRKLKINLARWAEHTVRADQAHVLVNIPEYRLRVYANGRQQMDSRVIVGKRRHKTPELAKTMDHIVFKPYWHVPHSIATREMLPKVKADPDYFAQQNLDLLFSGELVDTSTVPWETLTAKNFPYRIRQKPGSKNALGQVKFMFPNHHSVYIHDTNARTLFSQPKRALSHGCIRVEQPLQLAQSLLHITHQWSDESVQRAIAAPTTQRIVLNQTIAVHIAYFTARASHTTVHFFDDVYGKDQRALAKLDPSLPLLVAQTSSK